MTKLHFAALVHLCLFTVAHPQETHLLLLPPDNYVDVSFSDSLHGWIAGSNAIYRTTDGGNVWTQDSISTRGWRFYAVCSPSPSSAWLTCNGSWYNRLSRTTNGGSTWEDIQTFCSSCISDYSFDIVRCSDTLHVWVATSANPLGGASYLEHSTDGGQSWLFPNPLGAYDWYINSFASLALASDSLVAAIFSYRFLYTTTNAGASWRKDTLPGPSRYNALAVRPADCVWVVGDSGKILRFGTDGAGYLPQRSGTTANLLSISALDTLNILVTGQQGTLLETTDGGSSWQKIAAPVAVNLNAVYFVNRNLAWIVGDSGVVMQYRNGMLSDAFEHARISQSFVLNHCYPNPFNPSTRISFYLNSGGFVRLEAYDVAGRLADILLQQNESTGSHVVDWTPSRLSSGVYFITLKIGSGVSFQKVVFIR